MTRREPLRVLRITAGGRPFGLEVGSVRAIDRPDRWARLPWAPAYVLGVCEVGGVVAAVIDLATRLGIAPQLGSASQGVVLIDSAEPVALAVEAIGGVASVDPIRLRDLGAEGRQAGVRGITPDGLVLLEPEPIVDARALTRLDTILTRDAQAGSGQSQEDGA